MLLQIVRQFRAAGIVGAEVRRRSLEEEKRDAIAIPLFRALTPEQIALLAAVTLKRTLLPEDVLFTEGSSGDSPFIVVSGIFEVARNLAGASTVVGRIGPDDYIGEIALLTGAPYGAGAKAITDAVVLELRSDDLRPLMASDPDLLHAFEISARRGQSILQRSVAASVGAHAIAAPDLFSRIKSYFAVR
ncbi:cyclic nucleotide-binding domain-containing protein [Lichenifustis flavocetrariae]|uniref:Cyclic nucleotide-binding domain-containing protein n=1 Tax=Lichenifustis flavocetrariae TaxID=2949735 RepID=A0AA41Z7C9_9HYPH|nr:cyclic nucleotide-binding domain-containing protein [Lichenifustis flavocetrariae]MCW6511843.1 cyclic nucleotide-binding domain-containing protein [Lichenifustis flavocetrariae]